MKYALIVLSLLFGFGVWISLSNYEARLKEKYSLAQPSEEKLTVLVYASDIEIGETITEPMIISVERLVENIPDDYVRPSAKNNIEFIKRLPSPKLARSVRQLELVREDDFKLLPSRSLSSLLDPDYRAIAIKVSEEKIAGGFVLPGDRVDLTATMAKDFSGEGIVTAKSYTFLENVKVLAVGQDASFGGDSKDGINLTGAQKPQKTETRLGTTITLELTSRQVEILNEATQLAKINVALRRSPDQSEPTLGDISFLDHKKLAYESKYRDQEIGIKSEKNMTKLVVVMGGSAKQYEFESK